MTRPTGLLALMVLLAGCASSPVEVDRRPVPIFQPAPAYPIEMKRIGATGEVTVEFVVDTEGHVAEAHAVSSTNPGFEAAAVAAISRGKYRPGVKGGRPVNVKIRQTLYFSLEDTTPARK